MTFANLTYEYPPSHPMWAALVKEDIVQRAMVFNNCLGNIFFPSKLKIPKHLLQKNVNVVSILYFVQLTDKDVIRNTNIETQTPW